MAATLQHKDLSGQHQSALQGSQDLRAQLEQAQAAHEELSKKHSEAQDTIKSLTEKVAGLTKENESLTKEKEGLALEVSSKDAKLREAVEAADRAQEEAEAQITDAARKAAEEGEAHQFRAKNIEADLRSSETHVEELEALLKASEASESVLKARAADAQSKVTPSTSFCSPLLASLLRLPPADSLHVTCQPCSMFCLSQQVKADLLLL